MGLFNATKRSNMDEGLNRFRQTEDAVLIDVRAPQDYVSGHIPGSVNVPFDKIDQVSVTYPEKNTPLSVYCYGGVLSAEACSVFERAGYTDLTDLGGFIDYHGSIER